MLISVHGFTEFCMLTKRDNPCHPETITGRCGILNSM